MAPQRWKREILLKTIDGTGTMVWNVLLRVICCEELGAAG
jgi:hypothetical protein